MLRDREDQQEAFAAAEVIISNGSVVLLARRVQDVDLNVFAIQDHFLPVAVRLCGLVVLHKLATTQNPSGRSDRGVLCGGAGRRSHLVVHELQRERRLPHTATAHHDHLMKNQRGLALVLAGGHDSGLQRPAESDARTHRQKKKLKDKNKENNPPNISSWPFKNQLINVLNLEL